jgi:hypothetical protein
VNVIAGAAIIRPTLQPGSAASQAAKTIWDAIQSIQSWRERSVALFGRKQVALSELSELVAECSEQDWDGYDANPASAVAAAYAEEFVRALPEGVPIPEFAVDPDGSIALDWIESRYRRLSVSVGESRRLPFAWMDGSERGYGVARFDGEVVPDRLLIEIERVTRR